MVDRGLRLASPEGELPPDQAQRQTQERLIRHLGQVCLGAIEERVGRLPLPLMDVRLGPQVREPRGRARQTRARPASSIPRSA